jgi:putative membrane-bound dehydrogenase-like protein
MNKIAFAAVAVCLVLAGSPALRSPALLGQDIQWKSGVAKKDITPTVPVRLSGYASRSTPSVGVSDSLSVRALVLHGEEKGTDGNERNGQRYILVSVDSIGLPEAITLKVLNKIREKQSVQRSEIVFCASHSHATPHLDGGLSNLFAVDLPAAEQKASVEYTEFFIHQIAACVIEAIEQLQPVELFVGQGDAQFGVNRRVLNNRAWAGAGNPPEGVRDTSVPVMGVRTATGKWLAVAYDYACHCTSISPDINQISGDWAGISATNLEKLFPGIVALPVIGCGADINPNPRGTLELAQKHGAELASSVQKVMTDGLKPLFIKTSGGNSANTNSTTDPALKTLTANFGFAGLAPERPTRDFLQKTLAEGSPHRKRWAKNMLAIWDKMGRIPETYPAPIHTWRFGDSLTWVFLSGEVVCDYQVRLKREMTADQVWVTAYTDDCFGYVASERMRSEGGYEVDDSMTYYNQPGRWQSGTEELIVRRVKEIYAQPLAEDRALTPEEAIASMRVPAPYVVDLVAAEPLVEDPVHLAFDAQGRLWVVEMRDYPEGNDGRGGCIKILEDTNQDSKFDKATVFMDGLSWPNGVYPWRDGAVVSCAPDIFFARDTNGDGKADEKKVLVTGFPAANPQHRVNGFSYSLNHELQFNSGDSADQVTVTRDDSRQKVAGRDIALDVDRGLIHLTTGTSQYGRSRDDWENWFGNSNSYPMYHFVIEEDYLRNSKRAIENTTQQMFDPPVTPPVFPASRTVDRFNDLWTANRFTSACAAIVIRDHRYDVDGKSSLLVCEPVHNLIHRSLLTPLGATFAARRAPGEEQMEWFRSTDPWSRPVFVDNGPDGAMYIADMYRQFIEHTEWIPLSWQERIDVRAGEGKGRIYRVRRQDMPAATFPNITQYSIPQLVQLLDNASGTLRDLAMQQLIWRNDKNAVSALHQLATSAESPVTRLTAWATLRAIQGLDANHLRAGLNDANPDVRRMVLRWSESLAATDAELRHEIIASAQRTLEGEISPRLALQYVLTLGQWEEAEASTVIANVLTGHGNDPWIIAAAATMKPNHDAALANIMLQQFQDQTVSLPQRKRAIQWLTRWLTGTNQAANKTNVQNFLNTLEVVGSQDPATIELAAAWLRTLRKEPLDQLPLNLQEGMKSAATNATNEKFTESQRIAWISWMGIIDEYVTRDTTTLYTILTSAVSLEIRRAALQRLVAMPDRDTAEGLISIWSKINSDLQVNVATALSSKTSWTNTLLNAVESAKVPVTDLDPATISMLRGHENENIRKQAEKLFGTNTKIDRDTLIATLLTQIPEASDSQRGEALYRKHCAQCHQPVGELASIGPNLGALTDRSKQAMLTAIVHPNKAVEAKYKQRVLVTTEGETLRGVVIQENASGVTLGMSDGSRRTIPSAEIDGSRDLEQSLMPEGFEKTLGTQELADMIKFLQTVDFSKFK